MNVMNAVFFFNSILLGVGLAMDAFSVSLANGLNEPGMNRRRACAIAGTFAFFQFLMPMAGWVCVHTLLQRFAVFERFVPWLALALLAYIGGSMLREGLRGGEAEKSAGVGAAALICALIIAAVTFAICLAGLAIGRAMGTRLAGRASVLGGVILILIGVEIFIKGLL